MAKAKFVGTRAIIDSAIEAIDFARYDWAKNDIVFAQLGKARIELLAAKKKAMKELEIEPGWVPSEEKDEKDNGREKI